MTLETFTQFIDGYGIWILLPIAIIEGPVATLIGGFMASLGELSLLSVYGIVVLGDMLGDAGLYIMGRWGYRHVHRFARIFGITEEKRERVTLFFKTHQKKALVFSKIAHGIGVTGLLTAGAIRIPYHRYVRMCGLVSAIQALLFLVLGYFFGHAYKQILGALNIVSAFVSIVVLIVLVFIIRRFILRPIESYGSASTTPDSNDM
ncbi:MAG: hypothetical protein KIH62_005000 [Candidatus Kerfeldbacteria bacterium]|nr:hypothetical protein [Candidatus Kerfeldbacteria bacterium]